jgi:hypothetical protein
MPLNNASTVDPWLSRADLGAKEVLLLRLFYVYGAKVVGAAIKEQENGK